MLDLSLVKDHCRIDPDVDEDDQLLKTYVSAAARYVENYTRRHLYKSADDDGYADDCDRLLLTEEVQAAMLLLVGHWYENREATVTGQATSKVPLAVDSLLQPHKIYGI
jgi:uncharacterized phage protein (predicted DNA packaging)